MEKEGLNLKEYILNYKKGIGNKLLAMYLVDEVNFRMGYEVVNPEDIRFNFDEECFIYIRKDIKLSKAEELAFNSNKTVLNNWIVGKYYDTSKIDRGLEELIKKGNL